MMNNKIMQLQIAKNKFKAASGTGKASREHLEILALKWAQALSNLDPEFDLKPLLDKYPDIARGARQ